MANYHVGCGVFGIYTGTLKKLDKVTERYEIIDMDSQFISSHYVGKNCENMDTYRDGKVFLTLYYVEKV